MYPTLGVAGGVGLCQCVCGEPRGNVHLTLQNPYKPSKMSVHLVAKHLFEPDKYSF